MQSHGCSHGNICCQNYTFSFFSLGEGVSHKQWILDYCPWRKLSFSKFIIPSQFKIKKIFYLQCVYKAQTIQREFSRQILCTNESVWGTPQFSPTRKTFLRGCKLKFINKILAWLNFILEISVTWQVPRPTQHIFNWYIVFLCKIYQTVTLKPSF